MNTKPFIFLLFLLVHLSAFANDPRMQYMQILHDPHYFSVTRDSDGKEFHVFVSLPHGYSEDTKYPAIYLIDGGIMFPMLASYNNYLSISEELPPMIVVGISYGVSSFEQGNSRGHDFTLPSTVAGHYGGAEAFSNLLKRKVINQIETRFSANPEKRILFGQSLGGQFALYMAMYGDPIFWAHIASNPALHNNVEAFLNPVTASTKHKRWLYVAQGSDDSERFRVAGNQWRLHWQKADTGTLHKNIVVLPNETHLSAPPSAFRNGLAWLFNAAN
ncbi:alpha/beta hydrolase-fold protein [Lacimicrobium sp. SS2-24]|uniref:alpha/beta hydrolase n=1 Tax=Lacimicrobium sp. SS2-24 TaxID=2005569 RepID=UPI000B4AEB90|nr:alpha/beta hydrolase-fold protein [Lacimicrobium sp. SS2-24]